MSIKHIAEMADIREDGTIEPTTSNNETSKHEFVKMHSIPGSTDGLHEIIPADEVPLKGGGVLHRFENSGGVPYSAIYINGDIETYNQPRAKETQMIEEWNRAGFHAWEKDVLSARTASACHMAKFSRAVRNMLEESKQCADLLKSLDEYDLADEKRQKVTRCLVARLSCRRVTLDEVRGFIWSDLLNIGDINRMNVLTLHLCFGYTISETAERLEKSRRDTFHVYTESIEDFAKIYRSKTVRAREKLELNLNRYYHRTSIDELFKRLVEE